ncbi:hypothetical protein ACN6A1_25680 [Myxococcus virescens]|uniref:hypothetical protein n=1 Tax=Myxococcus virescens TaxID=83456 RepID=UPI003DA63DCC
MRPVTSLWVVCALLMACAGGPRHFRHGELGFVDSDNAAKARYAAYRYFEGRPPRGLKKLWPAPFSIEQRYRYYPNARLVESLSKEKEARLIADGCTDELRGTIKPDLVLHENRSLLLKSVLTLDFKFPCPDT